MSQFSDHFSPTRFRVVMAFCGRSVLVICVSMSISVSVRFGVSVIIVTSGWGRVIGMFSGCRRGMTSSVIIVAVICAVSCVPV